MNDLYENKNLYMIVDNLYNLGGMVSINRFLLALGSFCSSIFVSWTLTSNSILNDP